MEACLQSQFAHMFDYPCYSSSAESMKLQMWLETSEALLPVSLADGSYVQQVSSRGRPSEVRQQNKSSASQWQGSLCRTYTLPAPLRAMCTVTNRGCCVRVQILSQYICRTVLVLQKVKL